LLGLSYVLYGDQASAFSRGALIEFAAILGAVLLISAWFGRSRLTNRSIHDAGIPWGSLGARFAAFGAMLAIGAIASGRSEVASRPVEVGSAAKAGRPNIVLVVMDTVGARHMSLYGYERPTTPRIEALAREATVYGHAISPGNMTLTSHASLFTGIYAARHGALPPFGVLGAERDTLAEILARAGYVTAGVVANHGYLDDSFGLAQGFQHWNQRATALPVAARAPYFLRRRLVRVGRTVVQTAAPLPRYPLASQITPETLARLDALSSVDQPFFLFVNYMDTHEPYDPGPPFDNRFGEPLKREVWISPDHWAGAPLTRTPEGRRRLAAMYDGAVAAVDAACGAIVDRLKALNQYENTLIIITSDHGEAFGEAGMMGHGGVFLGQPVIHVPLVIKYPGDSHARRVDRYVSLVDLLPTVLDLLDLPIPTEVQGASLLVEGGGREVISEGIVGEIGRHESSRAIIADGMKLVLSNISGPSLYDLSADPEEQQNLYRPDDPRGSALAVRLDAWLGPGDASSGTQQAPDAEALERLRSLGYVR
jgi:arylsulfatase A-like enzyme